MSPGSVSRPNIFLILSPILLIAGLAAPFAMLPAPESWQFSVIAGCVLALTLICYQMTPARNPLGRLILMCVWVALSWGCVANLHLWTIGSGHSFTDPLLLSNDDLNARQHAMEFLGYKTDTPYLFGRGSLQYVLLLIGLMKLFGLSILPPLGLSMLAVMLAVVMTGALAGRILSLKTPEWRSNLAMLFIAMQAYWLAMGTMMTKEACVILGVSATLTGLSVVWRPSKMQTHNIALWGVLLFGLALTGVVRLPMALMTAGAALFLVRRDNMRAVVEVVVIAYLIYQGMHDLDLAMQTEEYFKPDTLSTDYFDNFNARPTQGAYMAWAGDYNLWPAWRKALWLPVAMAVQFIIPLPWNAGADIHRAITLAYAHQGWMWYIEGGLAISWLISCFARRSPVSNSNRLLIRYAAWLVVMWAAVAWMYAGAVSRYLLPFMPVAVCMAVEAFGRWHNSRNLRRIGCCIFALLLIALCLAYHLG